MPPTLKLVAIALTMSVVGCVLDYDALRRGRGLDGGADADRLDAGRADGGASCQRGLVACDDGWWCNGQETCDPGMGAGPDGCRPGVPMCTAMETCHEGMNSCASLATCPDNDGDRHAPLVCGGDDCEDSNSDRYPGNREVCNSVDEDCDCATFGSLDFDGDGYVSSACCNCIGLPAERCGTDCNDMDRLVHPGAIGDAGVDANCGIP